MTNLNIPGSDTSPEIDGNVQAGRLVMRGDSYPENACELFAAVTDWVRDFIAQSAQPLVLELYLSYLNTSSVKAMMEIFDLLEVAHRTASSVAVTWFYEARNELAADVANKFKEDCSFPFLVLPLDQAGS